MGYTPKYGANRTSAIMKTKELAGKSALFNLGEVSPINHDLSSAPDHTHIENSDKYTYQRDVKTGTKRQSRSGRNELARNMANAANAEAEGFEGTQYNTEGHMRSGSKGSIKLFTKKNILEARTGTRGGGSYGNAVETKATYKKVKAKDVNRIIKSHGSASITNGVVSPGTTQTETATGSTKRDTDKAARISERAKKIAVNKNLKTRAEGERSRDMLERKQAREKMIAERKNKKTNKK